MVRRYLSSCTIVFSSAVTPAVFLVFAATVFDFMEFPPWPSIGPVVTVIAKRQQSTHLIDHLGYRYVGCRITAKDPVKPISTARSRVSPGHLVWGITEQLRPAQVCGYLVGHERT